MHEELKVNFRKKLEVLEDENKKCKQSKAIASETQYERSNDFGVGSNDPRPT